MPSILHVEKHFNASDTVNSAYTFDWGGTTEPLTDGLFEATYDFPLAGNYTFNI